MTECPICYEMIEGTINTITTECGHMFHAKCLMQNVSHNGFGCPCCRTQMVEKPANDVAEDDSDYDSEDGSDSDDDDDEEHDDDDHDNEYILRGFRLFTNRIEGHANDPSDVNEDYVLSFYDEAEQPTIPSAEYITEKLVEQGITMYQLVTAMMLEHVEYEGWVEGDSTYDNLTDRIRALITDFPNKHPVAGSQQSSHADQPAPAAVPALISPPSAHPLRV